MPRRITNHIKPILIILILLTTLTVIGCVSSKVLLNRAEETWARGSYAESINMALESYEKAVEKNKKLDEIDAAKNFLSTRFPQANENLKNEATRLDNGSDSEKVRSWQIWQTLVNMNRRIKDSIASTFLETRDYSGNLDTAKKTAAQIRYVEALELIGRDERSSYIQAAGVLKEIDNSLYPGYRDIAGLLSLCYEKGTLTIAFSSRSLYTTVRKGSINSSTDYNSTIIESLRNFIESNDNPDFLTFIDSTGVQAARDSGAWLFIELQGDIWVSADTKDSYGLDGRISWERSYGGTPILSVTRLTDNQTEIASSPLSYNQSVQVEFYPQRYQTTSLTADMFNNRFNNADWMDFQLLNTRIALADPNGIASLSVWAEMEYGGSVRFLKEAEVLGDEGAKTLPIEVAIYSETEKFLNSDLPKFLSFSDIDLHKNISDDVMKGFLASNGVKNLLANLD